MKQLLPRSVQRQLFISAGTVSAVEGYSEPVEGWRTCTVLQKLSLSLEPIVYGFT